MESLQKLAQDNRAWLGVIALALTIAVELMADADSPKEKPASFVDREKTRRTKENLEWLTR